ncbi:DUF6801 domain-containing protein [Nocardioides sp.]|uniref:DUF6801 domain-containing protein n=1 Tax=Nocardioides sp. TaxID=35761 RepID=UPI002ED991B4
MSMPLSVPRSLSARLGAFGASAALVAGAVVATAPAAEAEPVSLKSSYTCTTALGDQTMAVTVKIDLPTKVRRNKAVASRPVKMKVVVPESLVTPMRDVLGITALSGSASDIAYRVGAKKVPLANVTIPRTDVPASGAMTLKASGTAKGFRLKKPGKYVIRIPSSFTFNADNQDGQPVPSSPFPCAVAEGAPTKLGVLKVVR